MRHSLLPTLVLFPLLCVGCDDEQITAYVAPQDAPRPTAAAAPMAGPTPQAPAGPLSVAWDVPPTWSVCQSPPAFVIVAYDDPAHRAQTTVSRLAGTGGGALANINRWRNQIGLPPVTELEEQPMERVETAAGPAGVVDLVGEAGPGGAPARVLAALLPLADRNETWFFKMTGPKDVLDAEKPAFLSLVASARPRPTPDTPDAPDTTPDQEAQQP